MRWEITLVYSPRVVADVLSSAQLLYQLIWACNILWSVDMVAVGDVTFHGLSYNLYRILYNAEYEAYEIMTDTQYRIFNKCNVWYDGDVNFS